MNWACGKIDAMIPQDLDQRQVSVGVAVKAMILTGLGFVQRALYLTPDFFKGKPVGRLLGPGITAGMLNDDALGRALDAIFAFGVEAFYFLLASGVVKQLGLSGAGGHLDAIRSPRSVWSMASSTVCPFRAAFSSASRANGSITAAARSRGFFSRRLSHCSRMSWRSVSSGSRFASSAVFGVCPSIIAPTASANLPTTVLRNPGSAAASPRSTSSASFFTVPIGLYRQKSYPCG